MKYKWTLFTFSRGDFKTLERYLNKQAEQGWELEKVGILARWKRTERTDLAYCVDLLNPKQDRNEQKEYIDFCAEGGWELVSVSGNMYIFKSMPGANVIPIQTDREIEKKQYNRYYIRSVTLSVLIMLGWIAFWLFVNSAMRNNMMEDLRQLRREWLTSWLSVGMNAVLPVWGIFGAWKVVDFIRAAIKGRTGSIGESPRWVLWLNCVMALVFGVGAAVFYIGLVLEFLFAAKLTSYIAVLSVIWGISLLWRAFEIENERFKGERRRHVFLGVVLLLISALLVAGRILLPYGSWSTSAYSADREKGNAVYEQTMGLPLIHGEDVGVPFEREEGESVYMYHEILPVGERWELRYTYGRKKHSFGLAGMESSTTNCFNESLAETFAEMLAHGQGLSRYTPWPEEGLSRIEIDWADEAWYGKIDSKEGEDISVLVLRAGEQVTRMIYPADLMSPENLESIRAELMR